MSGIADPKIGVSYELAGSSSLSEVSGSYIVPLTDSVVAFSNITLPRTVMCCGANDNNTSIYVNCYSPTTVPGTPVVRIFADGRQLDSPDSPGSCIIHRYADNDTCHANASDKL